MSANPVCIQARHSVGVMFLSSLPCETILEDLTNLDNPDPSLQHWPAVAAWWSSRACMQGPARELCDGCTSPSAKPVVFIWFTPLGQAPLSWRPFAWSSQVSTLCCLTATVCQSRSLRLKICGPGQNEAKQEVPFGFASIP